MILAKSNRLILRPFKEGDIHPYSEIVRDEEVMKYIGNGSAQSWEEAESYVKDCIQCFAINKWSRFAVELKETKEFIGFCGFKRYNNQLDLGWRYGKKHWGQGYGYEAARLTLNFANKQRHFPKIVCISYPENVRSIRIINKIGFLFEKEIVLNNKRVFQFSRILNSSTSRLPSND